ncbi:MAG: hypothetical protein WCV56_06785 [Candidatus Omnitrophota bacterium]
MDNHVYIEHDNPDGMEGLVQYIARTPLSQKKILPAGSSDDKIIYRSRLNPSLKRNFRIFDPPGMDSLRIIKEAPHVIN